MNLNKINLKNWICNGSINPLIINEAKLRSVCKDENDFLEAVRYAKINLGCFFHENITTNNPSEILAKYFELRTKPFWTRKKPILDYPPVFTAAQFLAKHGNTDCLAKCNDFLDLCACLKLVGNYNNFDVEMTILALEKFNKLLYYNENNPNNGHDLFHYHFGWEGSLVFYVSLITCLPPRILTADFEYWDYYSANAFKIDCGLLGKEILADETDIAEEDENGIKYRFWFD